MLSDAWVLAWQQMGQFVPKTLLTMLLSLGITHVLIAKGFLCYLSRISQPLTARMGLPETVIAASVLAFGSALSANAMLAELYRKQQLSEQEAFLGAILNGASINVKEIFTYQLPIMLPLLGWKAGGIYLACFSLTAVMRYAYVLLHARRAKRQQAPEQAAAPAASAVSSALLTPSGASGSVRKLLLQFLKIALTYVLITFVVLFVFHAGVGAWFEKMVAPISSALQLPVAVAVPMAVFIFKPVAGASAISLLRNNGVITDIDAALAVVVGSLLLLPLYGFRSGSIARTVSFFGSWLGFRISATSTSLAIVSRLIFLVLLMGHKLMAL